MIEKRNENLCVGCPQGCVSCGMKNATVVYMRCDNCGEEVDEVYDVDGQHICYECLPDMFRVIRKEDV